MQVNESTQASLAEIAEACRTHDDFSICGHVNPDGDCLGSVLAMAHLLESMGKVVQSLVVLNDPLDEPLSCIPGADALVEAADARPSRAFITVDATADERLGDAASALRAASDLSIVIDHHEVRECDADLFLIDPSAASTTCLVWELARAAGVPLTKELAACCYTGLMTDTGRFQYQNTDARAFRAAAQMMECGIDISALSRDFFQNRSLAALRIESLAVERLELLDDGQVAFSWIESEDLIRLGAKRDDCEGIINALRSIRGVAVACILKDHGECVRGSLRSKDGTDVSRIAARFGGGGHKAAAGFTLDLPLDQAIGLVKQALIEARAL